VIIKALYVILVLSSVAVVGVAIALYFRVKKHMANPVDPHQVRPDAQIGGEPPKG
jgi:hypothetical protein